MPSAIPIQHLHDSRRYHPTSTNPVALRPLKKATSVSREPLRNKPISASCPLKDQPPAGCNRGRGFASRGTSAVTTVASQAGGQRNAHASRTLLQKPALQLGAYEIIIFDCLTFFAQPVPGTPPRCLFARHTIRRGRYSCRQSNISTFDAYDRFRG